MANFATSDWQVTPVGPATTISPHILDEPFIGTEQPSHVYDTQTWSMLLTGVMIVNAQGNGPDFKRSTIKIFPDLYSPMSYAAKTIGLHLPPDVSFDEQYNFAFQVRQIGSFVTPCAMHQTNAPNSSGYAVDAWRPAPTWTGGHSRDGKTYKQLFNGVLVDIATAGEGAIIYRLAYQIHLVGGLVVVTSGPGFSDPDFS